MGRPGRLRHQPTGPLTMPRRPHDMTQLRQACHASTRSGWAGPDPSMEEILASIRRILNEDEPAGATGDTPRMNAGGRRCAGAGPIHVGVRSRTGRCRAGCRATGGCEPAALTRGGAGQPADRLARRRGSGRRTNRRRSEPRRLITRRRPRGGCPRRGRPRCERTGRNPSRGDGRTRRRTRVPTLMPSSRRLHPVGAARRSGAGAVIPEASPRPTRLWSAPRCRRHCVLGRRPDPRPGRRKATQVYRGGPTSRTWCATNSGRC